MAVNHATVQSPGRISLRAVAIHLDSLRELIRQVRYYIFSG